MPYVLLVIGAILFVSGVRGTNGKLWDLVKGDFTGSHSFLIWIAAIAIVGGMGYIPKLKPLSIAFMTLLLIVLFLSNHGVIKRLSDFVQNVPGPDPTNAMSEAISPLSPLQPLRGVNQ